MWYPNFERRFALGESKAMKQQKFYNAKDNFALICDMAKQLNLDEKVVELLFSRGIDTKEKILTFLNPNRSQFNDPFLLNGMKEAKEKILSAIENKKKILVFGDYDVDGVSATAILIKLFEKLGASPNYYLPNRFIDGYGLTRETIDKVNKNFSPNLIVTVDCGISCHDEVEYAKSLGIDVIVTDHHEIPEQIPETIVINPKLEGQTYPFKELCGTGVALKLAQAISNSDCEEFLPIAAVATIADIVSLTDENRAIVSEGLKLFERFLPLGVKELLKDNKIPLKTINSTDIAFKIAPKINSSGRMGEASDSLKLYLTTNPAEIKTQIAKINEYNLKRQKACGKVFEDCVKMLETQNMASQPAIILSSKDWDSGILGIVCARLVETYNRPAFLFSEENGLLKGSARSLTDINVHEILSSMKDVLETFGGHKMAAGMCLKVEHFSLFKKNVNSFILNKVSPKAFLPISYYDLDIEQEQISDKFLEDLEKLEPFGLGNAKPLLKISTSSAKISSLKNFPCHYNILIGKLNLVYFNCLDKYFSLKYAKQKNIVFEIQNKQNGQIKGIVKNFNGGFELDKSFSSNLDAYCFEQLKYLNNTRKVQTKTYQEEDIIELLAECDSSAFGTIFVTTKSQTYRKFIETYSCENIFDLFVFNNSSDAGYNALYLYPTNLKIFKNYKKIVFLDGVLDSSYLAEIKNNSNGEIYLPKNSSFNKKIFASLNLSRQEIGNFFVKLKEFSGQTFSNLSHMYNSICKKVKISFVNFYAYVLILKELGIISFDETSLIELEITKTKSQLSNSKIFNALGAIKQLVR